MFDPFNLAKLYEQGGFAGKPNEYLAWLVCKYPDMPHRQRVEKLRAFCHSDHVAALVLLDQLLDEITTRAELN